jgi:hypothetical protein
VAAALGEGERCAGAATWGGGGEEHRSDVRMVGMGVWRWQRAQPGGGHGGHAPRELSKSEEGNREDRGEREGKWEASEVWFSTTRMER